MSKTARTWGSLARTRRALTRWPRHRIECAVQVNVYVMAAESSAPGGSPHS
jgi:hypothetical protein